MNSSYSAFANHSQFLAHHSDLNALLEQVRSQLPHSTVTIFDDHTGLRTELEATPVLEQIEERLSGRRSGPGRPKLGVESREVSLLPRHWDWLSSQPGGASAAVRRLVDEARKSSAESELRRVATEGLDKAMTVLAGDEPGFEDALRALYAQDHAKLKLLWQNWAQRSHFERLLERLQSL